MILEISLSRNLNVDPSKRNVSLSVHAWPQFLKGPRFEYVWTRLEAHGRLTRTTGQLKAARSVAFQLFHRRHSLLCTVHAVPIRLRIHTMQQSSATPPCCIMSSRIIGACTISCVVLPRVQPCATTATQVNLCCYVLSGFHLFLKRVVRGRRLSAQSRWFRLFRWYFLFFKSRRRKIKMWYLNINELFLVFFFLNFFPRL